MQLELHVVVGDGAPHGGDDLRVDQGHPDRYWGSPTVRDPLQNVVGP